MIGDDYSLYPPLVGFVFGLLILGLGCAFVRLVRGPTLPDRVVALDLISSIVIGIAGLHAVSMDMPVLVDVAIVLALVSFLGTVAFARYLERRARDE